MMYVYYYYVIVLNTYDTINFVIQDVVDENAVTFPYISKLLEVSINVIEAASKSLMMSPSQVIE